MTIALPNPFIDSLSADFVPPADQLTAHVDHAAVLSIPPEASGTARKAPSGSVLAEPSRYASENASVAVKQQDMTAPETGRGEAEHSSRLASLSQAQPFFSYVPPSSMNSARLVALPANVVAELDAGIAAIVAGVARKSSHIAFRSFASNSTFNFPSPVKA